MERASLVRSLDPLRRQAGLVEIGLRLFQILLGKAAHADALGKRRAGALEHERVMAGLGDAAQVDRILVLVADDKADQIDIEGAALRQVFDVQHGMAGARDVEGRIVVWLGNAHGGLRTVRALFPAREWRRQLDTSKTPIHTHFA